MNAELVNGTGLGEWLRVIPLALLVLLLVFGWAVWMSPKGLAWWSQTLRARKAGIEAYRKAYDQMRPGKAGGQRSMVVMMNEDADGVEVLEITEIGGTDRAD